MNGKNAKNGSDGLGADFGQRNGPCIVEWRDWTWNGHPNYRSYSCLGCRWLEVSEYEEGFCAHPENIEKYGCHQYNGEDRRHRAKKLLVPSSCPVLAAQGVRDWPKQPDKAPLDRGPDHWYRAEEVFQIPQPRR